MLVLVLVRAAGRKFIPTAAVESLREAYLRDPMSSSAVVSMRMRPPPRPCHAHMHAAAPCPPCTLHASLGPRPMRHCPLRRRCCCYQQWCSLPPRWSVGVSAVHCAISSAAHPASLRRARRHTGSGAPPGEGEEWKVLLPRSKLGASAVHAFSVADGTLKNVGGATHVRVTIFPDGGIMRLRAFGTPTPF